MAPYPLINFEIQNYYQNEPKFNDVYSRNNVPKIKDGACVIFLDEYKWIGTHWICYRIAWSVEEVQKAKTQKLLGQQTEECAFIKLYALQYYEKKIYERTRS